MRSNTVHQALTGDYGDTYNVYCNRAGMEWRGWNGYIIHKGTILTILPVRPHRHMVIEDARAFIFDYERRKE